MKIIITCLFLSGCSVTFNNARHEPEQRPHSQVIIRDIGLIAQEGAL